MTLKGTVTWRDRNFGDEGVLYLLQLPKQARNVNMYGL